MKLVTINSLEQKELFNNHEDIDCVYPLKDYTVGYKETFNIEDINGFCLVNRILSDNELENLKSLLINSNIKGIIFDDLGIIDIIKDFNIIKILYLDHIANNSVSINYYLDYVDSVVVSTDLTSDEIKYILNNTKKELVLNIFSLKGLMYSRRKLLSNYATYHNISNESNMDVSIDDKKFKVIENEYGTKFFAYPYYNALELLDSPNVLYYWYDISLNNDNLYNLVINNDVSNILNDPIFLHNKTYFKVGDKDA